MKARLALNQRLMQIVRMERTIYLAASALFIAVMFTFGYFVRGWIESGMATYGFPMVVLAIIILWLAMLVVAVFLDMQAGRVRRLRDYLSPEQWYGSRRRSYKHPTTIEGRARRLDHEDQ